MKQKIRTGLLLTLLLIASSSSWYYWQVRKPMQGMGETLSVVIKSGTGASRVAQLLADRGVIHSPVLFRLALKLMRAEHDLRAGSYEFPDTLSPIEVIAQLQKGSEKLIRFTIPEGKTIPWIAGEAGRVLGIDSLSLIQACTTRTLLDQLEIDATSPEGMLFPETYLLPENLTAERLLTLLVKQFRDHFEPLYRQYGLTSGLTRQEALTLASIIQGEVMVDSEAVYISSVFHNRLQKKWKLQSCATVQYLLPDGPRRLLERDLKIESPYNTYLHAGLPPGPINSPGAAAIKAALLPVQSDYLFFVADGTGGHIFSCTGAEHVQARRTLDSLRRKLKRRSN